MARRLEAPAALVAVLQPYLLQRELADPAAPLFPVRGPNGGLSRKPLSRKAACSIINSRAADAGIDIPGGFRTVRATGLANLLNERGARAVQEIAGYRDPSIIMRYWRRKSPEEIDAMMRRAVELIRL